MLVILCIVSFVAGLVDSIAGGGGLLMLPALLLSGLPPQQALGTNKFAAMFGTMTALLNFIRNGKLLWRLAAVGAGFSIVGSILGTKCVLLLSQETTATAILMLLPVAALATFLPRKSTKSELHQFTAREQYVYVPLICLAIGLYDGFFGPGTGTFLILAMYLLVGMHLTNASALSKAFNLASNVGSFVTFALNGSVLYKIGLPIAIANLLGGYLGSTLAIRSGQRLIKRTMLLVFIILFITIVIKEFC
ncbi:sulfite exporter TauE/SafE family protein [Megalodesulfovibrio paquesii]